MKFYHLIIVFQLLIITACQNTTEEKLYRNYKVYYTTGELKHIIEVRGEDSIIYNYTPDSILFEFASYYKNSPEYMKLFDTLGLPIKTYIKPRLIVDDDSIKIGIRLSFYDSVGIGILFGRTNRIHVVDTLLRDNSKRGSSYYTIHIDSIPTINDSIIEGQITEFKLPEVRIVGFSKFRFNLDSALREDSAKKN